jgi:hypothetical protein
MQIQDLPRDINCHLSSIRAPLVRLINSARHSESKAELLRETLEVALANLPPKVEQRVETLTEPPETETKKPARKRATAKVKKDG